jgi:hypothetical protein
MTTITGLINGAKLATRGLSRLDLKFEELDIAGINYHGKLTLRRTMNHEYAWGCFVRIYRADDRHWMLDAYEDDPGVALDSIKEKMLQWAREREAEQAQP